MSAPTTTPDVATPNIFSPEALAAARLTIADRCDRCGAQAFVRVGLKNEEGADSELQFCAHHYVKYTDPNAANSTPFAGLAKLGTVLEDVRSSINVKPSISANAE